MTGAASYRLTVTGMFTLLVLLLLLTAGVAQACAICIPLPQKTRADHLVQSDTVVLARENPEQPFSYHVVETLKGVAPKTTISHLVNSSTRRLLQKHPERGVIFVVYAGEPENWISLGYAEAEVESVMREIVRRSADWRRSGKINDERLAFFANYLGNQNRSLHELAYLEIGRANYEQIREYGANWPTDQIRALLSNTSLYEWRPLAIMLLAMNASPDDRRYISDRFATMARLGQTRHLSAWATALVEIERQSGIERIESAYFKAPGRSKQELTEIIAALSEHGSYGQTHLRQSIVEAYSTLLDNYPVLAPYVARDLMQWRYWALDEQMDAIHDALKAENPLAADSVRLYVMQARKNRRDRP